MEDDMDPRGIQDRVLTGIARNRAVQIHALRTLGYTAKLKVVEALTKAGVSFDRCVAVSTVGRSIWCGSKETVSDFDIVVLLNQSVGNTVSPFATALANIKKAISDIEDQDQSLLFDKIYHDSVQVKLKAMNGARNYVTFEIVPAFNLVPSSPVKDLQAASIQQEMVLRRISESKDTMYASSLFGSSLLELLQNFMDGLDMYGAYYVHNVFTLCKHWNKEKIGNDPKLKNFRSRILMIELAAIKAIEVYDVQREQRRQKWIQIQNAQRERRRENAVKSHNGGLHVSARGGEAANSPRATQPTDNKIFDLPVRQNGGGGGGGLHVLARGGEATKSPSANQPTDNKIVDFPLRQNEGGGGGLHVSARGGEATKSPLANQPTDNKIFDFPLIQNGGGGGGGGGAPVNFGTLKQNQNKRRPPIKLLNTFENFLGILAQQRSQVHITFELGVGDENEVYHRQFSIMRNNIGVILNPVNPFHNLLDEVSPEEWAVFRKAARSSLDVLDDYRTDPHGIKLTRDNCF